MSRSPDVRVYRIDDRRAQPCEVSSLGRGAGCESRELPRFYLPPETPNGPAVPAQVWAPFPHSGAVDGTPTEAPSPPPPDVKFDRRVALYVTITLCYCYYVING